MIPPGENIAEKKICRISGQEFFITDKDLEFYDKISPVFSGQKYLVPAPTLCPDERQRRRLAFRNERKLYHRKCDKTGNQMISMYSADLPTGQAGKPFQVYDQKVWWSDDWSALDFGMKFDFERNFFEQFQELMKRVPRINLINKTHENSEFCNFSLDNKNSYLLFTSGWCENCYYSNRSLKNRNICDCSNIIDSELCYEVIDSQNCYSCKWLQNCSNCRDCTYGYNLVSCKNCFSCYGLVNKSFCIGNKQFDEKTYFEELKKMNTPGMWHTFQGHLKSCIRKYANNTKTENSTGDNLSNAKNSHHCFESDSLEDCKYVFNTTELKDCYDINNNDHSELNYEVVGGETSYLECFCDISWFNRSIFYSSLCFHSVNLFGCTGIKKGKNCILNTSYSQQEYEILCGRIIDHMRNTGEWGEFFPHELSPFGYNETVAQEYFPLIEKEVKSMPRFEGWRFAKPPSGRGNGNIAGTQGDLLNKNQINPPSSSSSDTSFKKEVTGKGWLASRIVHRSSGEGWNWKSDEETSSYHGAYYTPLDISQYDERIVGYDIAQKNIDELLNGILRCEISGKPFKVIRQELAFYIENGIQIPRKHPDQRNTERLAQRNPRTLYERRCDECSKNIISAYEVNRPEKVVCEECYQKLIY